MEEDIEQSGLPALFHPNIDADRGWNFMSDKICSVEGCDKRVRCKGVCPMHYHRLQRYGDPTCVRPRYARRGATCKIAGCGKKATAQELCPKHYYRMRAYGDPNKEPLSPREHYETEYAAYNNMKSRCYNANNRSYKDYGGRGIKMCDRWLESFWSFVKDMGKNLRGIH